MSIPKIDRELIRSNVAAISGTRASDVPFRAASRIWSSKASIDWLISGRQSSKAFLVNPGRMFFRASFPLLSGCPRETFPDHSTQDLWPMELGIVENLHGKFAVKQDMTSTRDLIQGYHPLARVLRAQLFDDLDRGLVLEVVHAHGGNFHPSRFYSRLVASSSGAIESPSI